MTETRNLCRTCGKEAPPGANHCGHGHLTAAKPPGPAARALNRFRNATPRARSRRRRAFESHAADAFARAQFGA